MAKYRKKPVVIEAQLYDGSVSSAMGIVGWAHGELHPSANSIITWDGTNLIVRTLEGALQGSPGDWIIKGVKGEFYPCKPDIFAATYEPAE